MTDIVKRLLKKKLCKDGVLRAPEKVKREAASEIKSLRAQLAEALVDGAEMESDRDIICDELPMVKAQRDEARAAFRKYGQHKHTCKNWRFLTFKCSCGFTAALVKMGEG